MGSKIEGGGTTAREGSAVARSKPQWNKGLSGAAFALVRLDTPGARNELRG
jgi:hypothetical protein